MKKLEQSILVMLIVTCIGMCLGSIIIAFQRSKEEVRNPVENSINQIYFKQSEEDAINKLLKDQIYPALMHNQIFPSSIFQNQSSLLIDEESKFYFVLEMLRTGITKKVSCGITSEGLFANQCRVLVQDFQDQALKIFGKNINVSLIRNESIYQLGEYIYSDYVEEFTPSFVLRFSSLTEKDGVYELCLNLYTRFEGEEVNYKEVSSWGISTLLSQRDLYGKIYFTYELRNNERIITTVSFLEV